VTEETPPRDASAPGSGEDATARADDPVEDDGPHRDDGLDLARSLTQATAGTTPAARRRARPRTRPGSETRRGRLSGAHPDDRDPQLLEGEMDRLVGERGWALPLRMRAVFARWPELVGGEVAEHCSPESFTDGTLVVRTDSTAWATQLKLLTPTIVRRLNEELGHGTVLVIEVLGPHLPTWKKGPRSVRDGRGPRDTYG
jgi:predicted nucleic acid-binding Zn ribbon protein